MPKVHVLPEHIASQIAAGEVVERPASVVKELVENSIDAGATQIEVSIASDCRDIRVADNGCGMTADDAVLAFQRHATSKLSSADDLWNLRTMGFRGEALPSVASISQLTCYTRCHDTETGTKLELADGKISTAETGCAPGTVIEVCDLFYNVPARLKFLKKGSTEFAHIFECVQSLAIAYPLVAFQLINDGEVVLRTTGSGKLALALTETNFFSGQKNIAKEDLKEVTYADTSRGIVVYGYLAPPTFFRGDRKSILSIVNNRPVRCPITYKALEYAFSDLIPRGKHPLAVVTVTLNAQDIDINVHPTKKEIKYSRGNDVYLVLQRALVEAARLPNAVGRAVLPGNASVSTYDSGSYGGIAHGDNTFPAGKSALLVKEAEVGFPQPIAARQLDIAKGLAYSPAQTKAHAITPDTKSHGHVTLPSGWHVIGYLHNTYILVETPEGLEIIEQHIAHERTLYERILAKQEDPGAIADSSQKLIISIPLKLSAEQKSCLKENLPALNMLGFDFTFDNHDGQVFCKQIPSDLATKEYETVVQKLVDDLCLTDKAEFSLEATKSIACQSAIKNGMPLSQTDIIHLLSDWAKTPRNDTCPHGRPVRLRFSMDKLFQLFHP
jgi:DNA mismatch repair protein MutL